MHSCNNLEYKIWFLFAESKLTVAVRNCLWLGSSNNQAKAMLTPWCKCYCPWFYPSIARKSISTDVRDQDIRWNIYIKKKQNIPPMKMVVFSSSVKRLVKIFREMDKMHLPTFHKGHSIWKSNCFPWAGSGECRSSKQELNSMADLKKTRWV